MNKKICVSIGHGRSGKGIYDPGACFGKYEEFKIAREIGRYAAEELKCDVINYDGNLTLAKRINLINSRKYDFVLEIHLNAGGGTGPEVYYFHGSPTGKKAADAICKNISGEFNVKNRGAKVRLNQYGKDYFGFIRQTKPCAILVETLFIDNEKDLAKIKTAAGQKKCGKAIAEALKKTKGGF